MAKVKFHPLLDWLTGKMGNLIFRRSHNGKISVYEPRERKAPWSKAQKDQRRRMGEASKYASAAVADPEIRAIYVQMALARNMNPKRPFDTAVSDYSHGGEDLLWKKHMGDQPKPANWDIRFYPWYVGKRGRTKKQRAS